MPDFSGYDVLESLKNETLLDPNKIILFTASSIPDKEAEVIGVKTILRKPLSLEKTRSNDQQIQTLKGGRIVKSTSGKLYVQNSGYYALITIY